MPSHQLIIDKGSPEEKWRIDWDNTTFTLTNPSGELMFEVATEAAHRIVRLHELDTEGKVGFALPAGFVVFKRQKEALRDIRALILEGIRTDAEFRHGLQRQARASIPRGFVAFLACGGLFFLYCWWASWAHDPPPGHWIYSFGWLVHLILLGLGAYALAGLLTIYYSCKQLIRIYKAERRTDAGIEH